MSCKELPHSQVSCTSADKVCLVLVCVEADDVAGKHPIEKCFLYRQAFPKVIRRKWGVEREAYRTVFGLRIQNIAKQSWQKK